MREAKEGRAVDAGQTDGPRAREAVELPVRDPSQAEPGLIGVGARLPGLPGNHRGDASGEHPFGKPRIELRGGAASSPVDGRGPSDTHGERRCPRPSGPFQL